jgi:hypothetical protein
MAQKQSAKLAQPKSSAAPTTKKQSVGATVQPCQQCPTKVIFQEHGKKYGFDDYTANTFPRISVEKGQKDTVDALITPSTCAAKTDFKSLATGTASVSPAKATSGKELLTLTGAAVGKAEIQATCSGATLSKLETKVYTRKRKTVAVRLVHEKNYKSTNVSDAVLKAFLKKVYDQAVFEFMLTRLPEMTVQFDLDKDGKVDVNSWMSAEMAVIRDKCKDDSYDYNIFLVDNPSDGSFGFMDYHQKYGYVHADSTSTPEKSFAHELGHGAFGLTHTVPDTNNIMSQGTGTFKWRLRHDQWDKINP